MPIPIEEIVVGGVYEGKSKTKHRRVYWMDSCYLKYFNTVGNGMATMEIWYFSRWAHRRVEENEK